MKNIGSTSHSDKVRFMTSDELASYLNVSKTSVYRLISKRTYPFYKVGGVIRFKKSEIDKYLDESRVEPMVKM